MTDCPPDLGFLLSSGAGIRPYITAGGPNYGISLLGNLSMEFFTLGDG